MGIVGLICGSTKISLIAGTPVKPTYHNVVRKSKREGLRKAGLGNQQPSGSFAEGSTTKVTEGRENGRHKNVKI